MINFICFFFVCLLFFFLLLFFFFLLLLFCCFFYTCVSLQYLYDGFSHHHSELVTDPPRKAMHDARDCFGNTCFTIPSIPAARSRPRATVKKSRSFSKRAAFRSQKSASIDCSPTPVDIVVLHTTQQTVV